MEGEGYENKKDNLQSASGMSGIFRHILWQSKCICRSETGIVGNGDTAETGKRLCRAGGDQNSGADFSGKVRLVFSGTDNSSGCAFEQCLTLPQNGKKQYTMTIPYADVSQTRGNGIVAFVDEKGNVVASEAFASIFGKEKRGIGVGVLSDHYDALGWMSMSGQTYYLHGKDQNVYLTRMDADTLQAQLDELYFLVIDSYDVSSLGKEKIKAIEKWVKNGGWLLIGTGERGKDTLGGFDSSFMEVSCKRVSKVGEENDASKEMQQLGSYSGFTGIDFHRCRLQICSGTI